MNGSLSLSSGANLRTGGAGTLSSFFGICLKPNRRFFARLECTRTTAAVSSNAVRSMGMTQRNLGHVLPQTACSAEQSVLVCDWSTAERRVGGNTCRYRSEFWSVWACI